LLDEAAILALQFIIVGLPVLMTPILMYVCRVSERLRNGLAVITAAITFILTLVLYPFIRDGGVLQHSLFEILPGLEISVPSLRLSGFYVLYIHLIIWPTNMPAGVITRCLFLPWEPARESFLPEISSACLSFLN